MASYHPNNINNDIEEEHIVSKLFERLFPLSVLALFLALVKRPVHDANVPVFGVNNTFPEFVFRVGHRVNFGQRLKRWIPFEKPAQIVQISTDRTFFIFPVPYLSDRQLCCFQLFWDIDLNVKINISLIICCKSAKAILTIDLKFSVTSRVISTVNTRGNSTTRVEYLVPRWIRKIFEQ